MCYISIFTFERSNLKILTLPYCNFTLYRSISFLKSCVVTRHLLPQTIWGLHSRWQQFCTISEISRSPYSFSWFHEIAKSFLWVSSNVTVINFLWLSIKWSKNVSGTHTQCNYLRSLISLLLLKKSASKIHLLPHRRHSTTPLKTPTS